MADKKCVYYCCTNTAGDVTVKWICIPGTADPPPKLPSANCTLWAMLDADRCEDCKDFVGELQTNNNPTGGNHGS
jgi:hypothetical protein